MRLKVVFSIILSLGIIFNIYPQDSSQLRVMTYNIKAGQESNIEQIADVIRAYDPDIVALQEVDVHWGERSSYRNQIRFLGDELDMHYFMGEIYALPTAGKNCANTGLPF